MGRKRRAANVGYRSRADVWAPADGEKVPHLEVVSETIAAGELSGSLLDRQMTWPAADG